MEFHTNLVHLDLKKGAVPKHHKSFPMAKFYEETLKKELEILCKTGVLCKCSNFVWAKLEGIHYVIKTVLSIMFGGNRV